jgi:hypothetical protein
VYESLYAFGVDARACGGDYYTDGSLQQHKLEAAYRVYQNANRGTKLRDFEGRSVEFGVTVVGRLALQAEDGSWVPSDESFPSIDAILQENLKTLGEDSADLGSVLNAKDWSLLANDAWVLGGIHATTEFHFASPLRWENLWAFSGQRMTVTAREAICISASGYEVLRPNPKLEAVAVCADAATARASSLLSFKENLLRFTGMEGLKRFYDSLPGPPSNTPSRLDY